MLLYHRTLGSFSFYHFHNLDAKTKVKIRTNLLSYFGIQERKKWALLLLGGTTTIQLQFKLGLV